MDDYIPSEEEKQKFRETFGYDWPPRCEECGATFSREKPLGVVRDILETVGLDPWKTSTPLSPPHIFCPEHMRESITYQSSPFLYRGLSPEEPQEETQG